MKALFKLWIKMYHIHGIEIMNRWIYQIRLVPIIKKLFTPRAYANYEVKSVLSYMSMIFILFKQFFSKATYLIFICLLPAILIETVCLEWFKISFELRTLFLSNVILLTGFNAFFLGSSILLLTEREDYFFLNLLHVEARNYYLIRLVEQHFYRFICFLLFFTILGYPDLLAALILLLLATLLRFVYEYIFVYIHVYIKKDTPTKTVLSMIGLLTMILCLGYPILTKQVIDFTLVLNYPIGIVGIILISGYMIYRLYHDFDYTLLARTHVTFQKVVDGEAILLENGQEDYSIDQKDIEESELNGHLFEDKHGYDYLNAIFFYRHKKLIQKPYRYKKAGILVVTGLLGLVLGVLNDQTIDKNVYSLLQNALPMVVFLMYSLGSGKNIAKALFYHCDQYLLKYGYFKDKKAILQNFTIRLKKIASLEIQVGVLLCVGISFILMMIGYGQEILSFIPFFGCILLLSLFFSVCDLCMYYLLQPYDKDGQEKGIWFKFYNSIMYLFSYMCLQLDRAPTFFTSFILILTLVGLGLSCFLVYRLGEKTFKLK